MRYYVYCTVKIIYNSAESGASRVVYGGESRFDYPEYSLRYYCIVNFFFTNAGFFRYNKIFEKLQSELFANILFNVLLQLCLAVHRKRECPPHIFS